MRWQLPWRPPQHLEDRWRSLVASGADEAEAERIVRAEARSASRLEGALAELRQARVGRARPLWPAGAGDHAGGQPARTVRRLIAELAWAWRGVRARGWRAAVVVMLLALALSGNALVFAVADSVVFKPVTYPDARQIVEIQQLRQPAGRGNAFMSAELLDAWRQHTDLFTSVQAYLTKTVFLVDDGRSEIVATADVTPGLIELLGVRPSWGRSLTDEATWDVDWRLVAVPRPDRPSRFDRGGGPRA